MSLDDDDENGSVESGSENDADETMEDVDAEDENDNGEADADGDADEDGDAEGDGDGDGDNDEENEDEEGDNEDEDDQEQGDAESPSQQNRDLPNGVSQQSTTQETSNPTLLLTSPSPRPAASTSFSSLPLRPSVRPEALTATYYDIVPTIAAPHSTSINSVTATPDMRWVFSGGQDGYIRKFSWPDTVNSKLMLTVAQRHPFVDSVTKAGVLLSYWNNEDPDRRPQTSSANPRKSDDNLSPVYSLAVHNQALWLLSGLESGGINLQTVRHDEGRRIHTLRGHTNAVSVLTLSEDEKSVLSGSWDKTINDWDLNTGQVKRKFATSGGQIAAIEPRPFSTLPVPQESGIRSQTNGTFSSNNSSRPTMNGTLPNGVQSNTNATAAGMEQNGAVAAGSPEDSQASLFGDNGDNESLFGDSGAGPSGGGMPGLDDDDEFSRAIASELQHQQQEDAHGDLDMMDAGGPVQPPPSAQPASTNEQPAESEVNISKDINNSFELDDSQLTVTMNGLPHSEEDPTQGDLFASSSQFDAPPTSDTTFLDASMNGTIRVWDRRQPNPIARLVPPRSVPPWCMNACWSPDGNFIYAGRRNGTVDEYSLHKGLKEPKRSFKFPPVSGPVSAVKAMPNGRHLICASHDILRLYDLKEELGRHQATPFYIVPGHRTGVISQLFIDPTCRFMITTGGNRGWEGSSTEVLLGYEIGIE